MLAMVVGVTYSFYYILCVYKPRRKYMGEEGYDDDEEGNYYSVTDDEKGGATQQNIQAKKSIGDEQSVASDGSSVWRFQVVATASNDKRVVDTSSNMSQYSAPVPAFQHKNIPAPTDLNYSAPVPAFKQTDIPAATDLNYSAPVPAFQQALPGDAPKPKKAPTRWLSRVFGMVSSANVPCDGETCVMTHGSLKEDGTKASYFDEERPLESVDTQDLGSLVSETRSKKKNTNDDTASKGKASKSQTASGKWKFRLVGGKRKKKQDGGVVEPYLSESDDSESHLNGVELVKSFSTKSAASSLSSSSSTEQLSESPSISSSSTATSSSSSSSSSSGFLSYSQLQNVDSSRPTTPVEQLVETLTTAIPPSSSASTDSSSSCDALSYVESNEAPTGSVQGLLQFEDWKDSDTASMPAPSTAVSPEHDTKQKSKTQDERVDTTQDESDSSEDEDPAVYKIQRLSETFANDAKAMAQKEGRMESFFDTKPSQIVWERSTLTTGYHRFDDV